MNQHALEVLEYGPFLDFLSSYARSPRGQEALRSLRPQSSPEAVEAFRTLGAEMLALRRAGAAIPAAAVSPPEEALRRAAAEKAVLDADELLAVRRLLAVVAEVRRFLLSTVCRSSSRLRALGEEMDDLPDLCRQLDQCVEGSEEISASSSVKESARTKAHVRDEASPRLRRLRRQVTALERVLQTRLEHLLNHSALEGVFQDRFITLRHDRYVVPVRRECVGAIRGIIHDQSHSGGTLFVEPESLVEMGNRLELLRLAERDEIRRILRGLTTQLHVALPSLQATLEALTRYDMVWAVSAWASEYEAHFPDFGETIRLLAARHPLLDRHMRLEGRGAELVPLDLELPAGCRVLVITGSNTGGKTVALKTIGLLTLLAQTGLPLPARPGTRLRFFADVQADIGDEQSIVQSLSTFSAHLHHIVEALRAAREAEVLVLLDELGAGTDPGEGGVLACALLEAFSQTRGRTFATTHLGAVKRFVHAHPVMENASMLFDVETLRPQYRMVVGRAGGSYALAIAERCGMPRDVVDTARALMSTEDLRLESLLASLDGHQVRLERERQDLARVLEEAREASRRARAEEERLHREREAARRERQKLLEEARREARQAVEETRRASEELLRQVGADPRREMMRQLLHRLQQRVDAALPASPDETACPQAAFRHGDVRPGDRVFIPRLQEEGVVLSVSDDGARARIKMGSLYLEADVAELRPPRGGGSTPSVPNRSLPRRSMAEVPPELNLVGYRTADAVGRLEAYLDAALQAGLEEVRIIHGFGTGALRRAVHACLDRWSVQGYRLGEEGRNPGGGGVTVVHLGSP